MTSLLKILFLPPMLFLNMAILCYSFHYLYKITKTHKKAKKRLYKIGYVSLLTFCITTTPICVYGLFKLIEVPQSRIDRAPQTPAEAIVILGAGLKMDTAAYGGETLDSSSLERVRAGAKLYQKYHLPVLVAGGQLPNDTKSVAQEMRNVLQNELSTPVAFMEDKSLTTYENARNAKKILMDEKNIKSIILVTHAYHMQRSLYIFEKMGFIVTPAPTLPITLSFSGSDYLPSAKMAYQSYLMSHEMIGYLWYRIKY